MRRLILWASLLLAVGRPPLVSLAFSLEVDYRSIPTIPSLLTLPGGNSFFSAQQDFACDTVQNFEVVLANGYVTVHPSAL